MYIISLITDIHYIFIIYYLNYIYCIYLHIYNGRVTMDYGCFLS